MGLSPICNAPLVCSKSHMRKAEDIWRHKNMKAEYNAEAMIENLKKRVSFYKRDLVSFDDLFGYMQALHDIGLLEADDITLIVSDLIK